jgi:hypothetical protein
MRLAGLDEVRLADLAIFRPAGARVNCGRGWLSRICGDLFEVLGAKAVMPLKPLFAAAAATVWLLSLMPAQAACVAPGFNPTGVMCNGCRYEGSMSVVRDQVCERPYQPNARDPIEIYNHRLINRAKHGIAGLNGTTFAYAPAKGYVGPDEFTIEVDYKRGGQPGKFTVHWNVEVQ